MWVTADNQVVGVTGGLWIGCDRCRARCHRCRYLALFKQLQLLSLLVDV